MEVSGFYRSDGNLNYYYYYFIIIIIIVLIMIYIGRVYQADKIIDRSWLNNDKLH
jgi:hypothetical protein